MFYANAFLGLLQKVKQRYRGAGLLYTTAAIAERVLPFNTFFLCELDLQNPGKVFQIDPDVRPGVIPIDNELLISLGAQPSLLCSKEEPETQFWVLEHSGQPVAYMTLRKKEYNVHARGRWLHFKLSPKDIWGESLWVGPEWRGHGFGPRLQSHVAAQNSLLGYARIRSIVNTMNRSSLRADEKIGYKRICHVFILRIFGLTMVHTGRSLRVGLWSTRYPLRLEFDSIKSGGL